MSGYGFCAPRQEEKELSSDGLRRVIKYRRLGLARVSVVFGAGEQFGLPFIDDYISTPEPVIGWCKEQQSTCVLISFARCRLPN